MSDVEFFEEKNSPSALYNRAQSEKETASMISWLVRQKIARNSKQANFLLLGLILLSVIISIILIFKNVSRNDRVPPKPYEASQKF